MYSSPLITAIDVYNAGTAFRAYRGVDGLEKTEGDVNKIRQERMFLTKRCRNVFARRFPLR